MAAPKPVYETLFLPEGTAPKTAIPAELVPCCPHCGRPHDHESAL